MRKLQGPELFLLKFRIEQDTSRFQFRLGASPNVSFDAKRSRILFRVPHKGPDQHTSGRTTGREHDQVGIE